MQGAFDAFRPETLKVILIYSYFLAPCMQIASHAVLWCYCRSILDRGDSGRFGRAGHVIRLGGSDIGGVLHGGPSGGTPGGPVPPPVLFRGHSLGHGRHC